MQFKELLSKTYTWPASNADVLVARFATSEQLIKEHRPEQTVEKEVKREEMEDGRYGSDP